jgi:2-polyprenyl-3-methyl-5-hydroxy-6-metoxy-1,4-benzoquinol methylase
LLAFSFAVVQVSFVFEYDPNMLNTTQTTLKAAFSFPNMSTFRITKIIGSMNGQAWIERRKRIQARIQSVDLKHHVDLNNEQSNESLEGQGVYSNANAQDGGNKTNYDIVNAWQVNYVRGVCDLQGNLLEVTPGCYCDDNMFGLFHSKRPGSVVLDVGCNTGKNMSRALQSGGAGTEVFGIEFSADSVAIARQVHGKTRVFQGDASANFVDDHAWSKMFDVVQCTAVVQHLTPKQVDAAMHNMSRCLKLGGELLLTFKDAPTKNQLHSFNMSTWADEVFSADYSRQESYISDGFLRATIWDDDYYPDVTGSKPPEERNLSMHGLHRREFVFYNLEWMKDLAKKYGLIAKVVEVMPDSKIPFSALHWMVIFERHAESQDQEIQRAMQGA